MLRKTLMSTLCASAVLTFATPGLAAQVQTFKSEEGTVEVTTVVRGLEHPWSVAFLPEQQGAPATCVGLAPMESCPRR
jgi:glucose/arabinose dehydrogenase